MSILTDVLIKPQKLSVLTIKEWDDLLRFSRFAKMMATIHHLAKQLEITDDIPPEAKVLLEGASVRSELMQLQASHELRHIERAFSHCDTPLILLKGAAYLHAGLPPAFGRQLSDIDLLVPKDALNKVENNFVANGWTTDKDLSSYDEHYYRDWSHEIPPLKHPFRNVEVDLHHNLIQPTSRIKLDIHKLLQKAVAVPDSRFHILCPTDMVIHSACHLFFNDELRGGLRDLWDMKLLCEHYAKDSDFYVQLIHRAAELGVNTPLYYALDAMQNLLGVELPENCKSNFQQLAPNNVTTDFVRRLIKNTLVPNDVEKLGDSLSQQLLYIRSHWVRMPPFMLTKHLLYKWLYQLTHKKKALE